MLCSGRLEIAMQTAETSQRVHLLLETQREVHGDPCAALFPGAFLHRRWGGVYKSIVSSW